MTLQGGTDTLLMGCDLPKASYHSPSHQCLGAHWSLSSPWESVPLHPDSPADHQPSCRPSASMVHVGSVSLLCRAGEQRCPGLPAQPGIQVLAVPTV